MKFSFGRTAASALKHGWALLIPLLASITPAIKSFGVSYNKVNASLKSDLTGQAAKVEEELWSRRIILGADAQYDEYPLGSPLFAGGEGANKAVIRVTDTEKVNGTTINITTMAGFGGPGVAGEGDRIGAEQKIIVGSFPVKIGRFWFGVGFTSVARDETMIGGRLDASISKGLRNLHAKKRNDDLLVQCVDVVGRGSPTRNLIYPNVATTRNTIKSADILDATVLRRAQMLASGNGALPFNLTNDSGGSEQEGFLVLASHFAVADLESDAEYYNALQNAGVRGGENPLFKGGITMWNNMAIYRWYQRQHANYGPIGSMLLPIARAGSADANTGSTGTQTISGGGTAAAATAAGRYFQFFTGAQYTFHNADAIALLGGAAGGFVGWVGATGVGAHAYNAISANGATITLTDGASTIDLPGTTDITLVNIGDLLFETNSLGVPIGRTIVFGREALVCGMGSINGSASSPQMGKRTEEHRNHDMDHGIGSEAVWGCAAVKRAGDSVYPGIVVIEHAVSIPGYNVVVP